MSETQTINAEASTSRIVATGTSLPDADTRTSTGVIGAMQIDDDDIPQRTQLQTIAIVAALFLSTFVAALDATIISTAIPTIAAQLHASSSYSWIGASYLIANAASGAVWTKLSDIWGRKIVLLLTIAVFFWSSLVCALARDMDMLIAGRVLQGVGGGSLLVLPLVVISDMFSVRRRTLLIGLVEVVWAVAGGLGPVLGGLLTEKVTWRWIFYLNLPVAGTAFALILFCLDVHNPRTPLLAGLRAIDWTGGLSIVALTVMLLLGLNFGGEQYPWSSPTVICLIVFGVCMGGVFVLCEHKVAEYPLLPLRLLKSWPVVGCMLTTLFHSMSFIAASFYLPLYTQSAHAASPSRAGLLLLPWELPMALSALATGILMHHTGSYRPPLLLGFLVLTLGLGLFCSLTRTTPLARLVGLELLAGCGSGALFEPPLIALHARARQADVAAGTAMIQLARNLGAALALVASGAVVQASLASSAAALLATGLSPAQVETFAGASAVANVQSIASIADTIQREAVQDAFATAIARMFGLAAGLAGLGLASCAVVRERVLSSEHVETRTGLGGMEKRER